MAVQLSDGVAVQLSDGVEADIRAHAARDYPYECCGVLLGTVEKETEVRTPLKLGALVQVKQVLEREVKVVTALRAMPNVHAEGHERRYLISPEEMFQLERDSRASGLKILGFYHSHPDHPARPSEYDREWAWPWYSYIIVAVAKGEPQAITCWTLDDDRGAFQEEEISRE